MPAASMMYLVFVDAMTDPIAASEWLRVDAAATPLKSHVNLVVCCEEDGGAVLDQLCTPRICTTPAQAAYTCGKVVGRLPKKLADIAVFVVTFDGGVAACRTPDGGAWTDHVVDDLVGFPGADTCVGLVPPPSLSVLLHKVAQNLQQLPQRPGSSTHARNSAGRGVQQGGGRRPRGGYGGGGRGMVSSCGRCGTTLWSDAHRAQHLERLRTCEVCAKTFCSGSSLQEHVNLEHPRCAEPLCGCDETFPSQLALQKHIRELRRPITCGICRGKFTSLKHATKHARTTHPGETFKVAIRHFTATATAVCCVNCGALGEGHTCMFVAGADDDTPPPPPPAAPQKLSAAAVGNVSTARASTAGTATHSSTSRSRSAASEHSDKSSAYSEPTSGSGSGSD